MFELKYSEYNKIINKLDDLSLSIPNLYELNKNVMNSLLEVIDYGKLKDGNYISKNKKSDNEFFLANVNLEKNLNVLIEAMLKQYKIISFQIYNSYSNPLVDLELLDELFKIKRKDTKFDRKKMNKYHLNINFYYNQISDIMDIKIGENTYFKKLLNSKNIDTIDKHYINNKVEETFWQNIEASIAEYIPIMFDINLSKKEKIKQVQDKFKNISLTLLNLDKLIKTNSKIHKETKEDLFNRIKDKLNKMELSFGIKPVLNTGFFIALDHDSEEDFDISEYSGENYLKYLTILSNNCVLAKCSDKNISNILSMFPVVCGDYLYYEADANLFSIKKKSYDNKYGIFLSRNIKNDYTILIHEVEHFKENYIINKAKFNKNINDKNLIKNELDGISFISELHTKEMLLNIIENKSLLEGNKESVLEKALELSFKKQNIYLFNKAVYEKEDLKFSNDQYLHLKSKINSFLAKTIYYMLSYNFKNLVSIDNKSFIEKLNNGENKSILSDIHNRLDKSIIADVYIQNIITNKDKNIDLMLANSGHDLKTIGLLGDPHSKRIMFKSLIFIIRDVFYKFEKITKKEIDKNHLSRYVSFFTDQMISLKNTINVRLLINEYDNMILPKYYISHEVGNNLMSSIISNDIVNKTVDRMLSITNEEQKNYILSPIEIYARNSQVFNLKTFINTSFINNSSNIIAEPIKAKMKLSFSSSILHKIKSKDDYSDKRSYTFNFMLDEIPDDMHKEWKKINEELSSILMLPDYINNKNKL